MAANLDRAARDALVAPAPINAMTLSDRRARYFLNAVVERCGLIVGQSGQQVHIASKRTDYVVPGVLMAITDGDHSNRVWMGVNERRLFYIQRFRLAQSDVERLFHFCFGGATKVGWTFNFEPVRDEDVSVWGTMWPQTSFTEPSGSTVREDNSIVVPLLQLTSDGHFWVNDLAMMVQSSFRVAQRHGVLDSESPCPL
jgi:hypothetical protein